MGFVTFAKNTEDVDYLNLAYLQALNIKATQTDNKYAIIVDQTTNKLVTDKHRKVFDYVIAITDDKTPFESESKVFWLSPFKETIKLEADLLFTRSIDHWWTAFRLKDICLSTGAKTSRGLNGTVRKYRELFDANQLPDVYNGLMYFRYSQEAMTFFRAAQYIQENWSYVAPTLKKCFEEHPSTDVLYGLTALMVGEENCTMPSMDFINFVHMKSGYNGWSDTRSWLETVMSERNGDVIRVNNLNQYAPVHYYDKEYATKELIEYYESRRT